MSPIAAFFMLALFQPQGLTEKLQAIYDKADALKTKKDIPGLGAYLMETRTKDYVFFAKSGRHTLKDLIQGMATTMQIVDKVTKASVRIDHLTVKGTTATAAVSTIFVFVSKKVSDNRSHVFSEQVTGEDTWIKSGTAWKLKESKSTTEHFFCDGRPIGPK